MQISNTNMYKFKYHDQCAIYHHIKNDPDIKVNYLPPTCCNNHNGVRRNDLVIFHATVTGNKIRTMTDKLKSQGQFKRVVNKLKSSDGRSTLYKLCPKLLKTKFL